MEGEEESVRTIDCLRGRLVAERAASKNARDEADKLENKVTFFYQFCAFLYFYLYLF